MQTSGVVELNSTALSVTPPEALTVYGVPATWGESGSLVKVSRWSPLPTSKVRVTGSADVKSRLPGWLAVMVQARACT